MKRTPYDGARIFEAAKPLKTLIAEVEAKRNNSKDPLAKHYAGKEYFKGLYHSVLGRLSEPDILTVDQAAARMSITPQAYEQKADKGEALLIEIEGKKFVPDFQFGKDGKIDELKLDIAREFVLQKKSYFGFMDYIDFMTKETTDIAPTLPGKKLQDIFQQAGLQDYKCSLSINATMNQLADQRDTNPKFFDTLIRHLDAAVTKGGWDPSGGLSRPFRDKYNIPGLTIDEDRERSIRKNRKPPQP